MAKWYRSIRVADTGEALGNWLERHGLPVRRWRGSVCVAPYYQVESGHRCALLARRLLTYRTVATTNCMRGIERAARQGLNLIDPPASLAPSSRWGHAN